MGESEGRDWWRKGVFTRLLGGWVKRWWILPQSRISSHWPRILKGSQFNASKCRPHLSSVADVSGEREPLGQDGSCSNIATNYTWCKRRRSKYPPTHWSLDVQYILLGHHFVAEWGLSKYVRRTTEYLTCQICPRDTTSFDQCQVLEIVEHQHSTSLRLVFGKWDAILLNATHFFPQDLWRANAVIFECI